MKLRSHLVTLVIVSLLPVLLFAAVMVVMFSTQQRGAREKARAESAQAVSFDIDRELSAWMRALQALATSRHLDAGDLRQFREQAHRVAQADPSWEAIILADQSDRQLLKSRIPFDAKPPETANLDY